MWLFAPSSKSLCQSNDYLCSWVVFNRAGHSAHGRCFINTSPCLPFSSPSDELATVHQQVILQRGAPEEGDKEFKPGQQPDAAALRMALVGCCGGDSERPALTQRWRKWACS